MASLEKLIYKRFDPNQPRDDDGKWTDGGSSEGSGEGSGGDRGGGAGSADEAQRIAAKAAAGHTALEGLPTKPMKIGEEWYAPGPYGKARDAAQKYMDKAGLSYDSPQQYLKVDVERATRVANEFETMKHDPDNPAVKASYDALTKETLAQWQAIKETGLKVEWIKPGQDDPYATTPRLGAMDVVNNNHWWGFPTDAGFGSDEAAKHNNPMLQMTDEVVDGRRLMVNDVFRIVHDYFGHFKEGVGFRADGEENAWRSHAAMFSDLARGAMTSETRGQNSWVNYGPHGESNRTANAAATIYAPQKIGLMSEWTRNEGRKAFNPNQPRETTYPTPESLTLAGYPKAGTIVEGLEVGDDVPKINAIEADENYTELPGIREVSFSYFEAAPSRTPRTLDLAQQIQERGMVNPLIVVVDAKGPYILEGSHRYDALRILDKKSLPAVVVIDHSDDFDLKGLRIERITRKREEIREKHRELRAKKKPKDA